MKDKDPNEDEFNQDEQDNINEADDSFGLPDIDFNTLDEVSEEETEPEDAATDDTEEPVAEEEPAEAPAEEETTTEEPAEEPAMEDTTFTDDTDDTIAAEAEDTAADSGDEEDEPAAVDAGGSAGGGGTRTYVAPKPESNAPKLIIALIVTIIVSVGIWYFMFYEPSAGGTSDEPKVTAVEKTPAEKKKEEEAAKKREAERLAAEKAAAEKAAAEKAAAEATFSTISEPTGRYYIVIQSFIDRDMAEDLGKEMAGKGVSTALLEPRGDKKFNRLTLAENYDTFAQAQEEANRLKSEYGDGLWVVKY